MISLHDRIVLQPCRIMFTCIVLVDPATLQCMIMLIVLVDPATLHDHVYMYSAATLQCMIIIG